LKVPKSLVVTLVALMTWSSSIPISAHHRPWHTDNVKKSLTVSGSYCPARLEDRRDGTTYVQMRPFVLDCLGGDFYWDPETGVMTITYRDRSIAMNPVTRDPHAIVTSSHPYARKWADTKFHMGLYHPYESEAADKANMAPLRWVVEALHGLVKWDGASRTIEVDMDDSVAPTNSERSEVKVGTHVYQDTSGYLTVANQPSDGWMLSPGTLDLLRAYTRLVPAVYEQYDGEYGPGGTVEIVPEINNFRVVVYSRSWDRPKLEEWYSDGHVVKYMTVSEGKDWVDDMNAELDMTGAVDGAFTFGSAVATLSQAQGVAAALGPWGAIAGVAVGLYVWQKKIEVGEIEECYKDAQTFAQKELKLEYYPSLDHRFGVALGTRSLGVGCAVRDYKDGYVTASGYYIP
jgi:hypothetical protein